MSVKFCVVILSHGRAETMITHKTLRERGYTGKIFVLIDDEDEQEHLYKEKFGDDCLQFNKKEAEKITDTADLVEHRKAVVFARNAVFDVIEKQGYEFFLVLDDDYNFFGTTFDENLLYITKARSLKNLDYIFQLIFDYYASIDAETISLAQGGDFIGGAGNSMLSAIKVKRKVMNSFFCSTKRKFKFFGRINEDVNYYVHDGRQGKLTFQINQIYLDQGETQKNKGGLTDIYLSLGTYVKSFYSVMYAPSCVTVKEMGAVHKRLHHSVDWEYAVPKILSEKYKKIA